MAFQIYNPNELVSDFRNKFNGNFSLAETTENKTTTISVTPGDTKYPTEKAVSLYASKIYLTSMIPVTKNGDLLLHHDAPSSTGGVKGKLKYNNSGTLYEFVPDRTICDYRTQAAWTSANPVLLAGEIGMESDTKKTKYGDGMTAWNSLVYREATPDILGATLSGDIVREGAGIIQLNTNLPGCTTTTTFGNLLPNGSVSITESGVYTISAQFFQSDGFSGGNFIVGVHVGSGSLGSMVKGFENYCPIWGENPRYCSGNVSGAIYLSAGDSVYLTVTPPNLSGLHRIDHEATKMTIVKMR